MSTEIVACIVTEECCEVPGVRHQLAPSSAPHNKNRQLLKKRKQVNSFLAPSNPYTLTNTYSRRIAKSKFPQKLDAVTQRVLSGKDHKIKDLESEIGILKSKLYELVSENRLLSSLNRRNDTALSRFQDVEAELPSLLSYHNTEVRALKERYQKLSQEHRDQSRELRAKDATLQSMREQIASLNSLIKDKGLRERQVITTKLEESKETISELEEQQKHLSRQLNLEKKIFKQHLAREQKRYKDLKSELDKANDKISDLEIKLKSKDKFITDHLTRKEFHQARKVTSLNSGEKFVNRRVTSSSTAVTSSRTPYTSRLLQAENEEDDDDIDSELSFSQTAAPSIDSMMNQLKYTSSESDDADDSQVYKARPTSVPQLSLHTTASTPWAVDSRTFSIRQTSVTRQVTPTVTQTKEINHDQQQDENSKDLKTDESSVSAEVTLGDLIPTGESVSESSEVAANNYSKEALLAALKAIDSRHSPAKMTNETIPVNTHRKSITADTKAELIQELFGPADTNKTITNS